MDFSFSEEQEAVRELADRIFTDLATHERLREIEAEPDGDRFDRKLWAELAAAGLLGIALPEEVGGAGLGFVETGLLVEATGRQRGLRAHHRDPGRSGRRRGRVRHRGTSVQRWLPGVVAGDTGADHRPGRAGWGAERPVGRGRAERGGLDPVGDQGLRAVGHDRRRRAGAGPGGARVGGRVHRGHRGDRGQP